MALQVEIIKNPGETITLQVNDRDTSSALPILKGYPVKISSNYCIAVGDTEPVITAPMLGIAAADSTETASVDGTVDVTTVIPGQTVLRAKATTAANMDTAAELAAFIGNTVNFDRTGSTSYTFTVDENEATDPNVNGLLIVGGDIDKGTIDFMVKGYAYEGTSSY